MQKNDTGPLLYHTQNIITIQIIELDIIPETIKLLEESIFSNLPDISLGNDFFLDMTPKAKATKAKINETT